MFGIKLPRSCYMISNIEEGPDTPYLFKDKVTEEISGAARYSSGIETIRFSSAGTSILTGASAECVLS